MEKSVEWEFDTYMRGDFPDERGGYQQNIHLLLWHISETAFMI